VTDNRQSGQRDSYGRGRDAKFYLHHAPTTGAVEQLGNGYHAVVGRAEMKVIYALLALMIGVVIFCFYQLYKIGGLELFMFIAPVCLGIMVFSSISTFIVTWITNR
jgi:hypothetical protein